MTSREPKPIERTQLIEIALKTYQSGSPNRTQINALIHQTDKIRSALGHDAEVVKCLKKLNGFISKLRHARRTKAPEVEESARQSALLANAVLQGVIAQKERNN